MNAVARPTTMRRTARGHGGRVWMTPWMATGKGLRWFAGVIYFGSVAGVALWLALMGGAHAWMAIRVLAACVLIASATFVSFGAAMARVAWQSHWPGVPRSAAIGAWIYALAGVAFPGIVIGALRPALAALTVGMCAFGVGMGLVYMLAPYKYRASGVIMIIILLNPGLDFSQHLAAPWFAAAMAGVALIVAVTAVRIWRRMVRSPVWDCPLTMTRGATAARSARTASRRPGWAAWNAVVEALFRPHGAWRRLLQARIDITRSGPRWPVRSMRIALGGFNPPTTRGARLALGLLTILVVVVVFLVFARIWLPHDVVQQAGRAIGSVAIFLAEFICGAVALRMMDRRWHRQTDLAVLALLPGLGTPTQARRRMLRAILGAVVSVQACCWAAMVLIGAWLGLHWRMELLMTMLALACATAVTSYVLHVLGGYRPRWSLIWATSGLGIVWVASMVLTVNSPADARARGVVWMVVIAWALCCVVLAPVAWRGWKRFAGRPHPFLPDTR